MGVKRMVTMSNKLDEATDLANLKENISENDVCVVDFTVPWSPACITMEQNLDEMAKEFPSVKFIKLDLEKDDEILYTMELKALPTVMIFQNQKGIGKVEGLRPPVVKEALSKLA